MFANLITALLLASGEPPPVSSAAERCFALAGRDVAAGLDVSSAEPVHDREGLPPFCRVRGVIAPEIGFEARLPLENWNRKLLQTGCGGFCGQVLADKPGRSNAINYAVERGYAAITTDGGHKGAHIGDARWALDNAEAEAVYAHRAIPLTHAAAYELIRAVYSQDPRYAYFSGCSNGGRMAAIAAQRYPRLFDGVVSGCPVLDLAGSGGIFGAWVVQSNTDENGDRVLGPEFNRKLPFLEHVALEQCDRLDGEPDGVIAAPLACNVNLASVPACGADEEKCLTAEERRVVAAWYGGPRTSEGEALFAGMPAGSERFWRIWHIGAAGAKGPGVQLAEGYGRYLAYPDDDETLSAHDFDFDRDVPKLARQALLFNALDTDLSDFRDAGGKMLMWHGAADPLVLPDQSVDYFKAVASAMGGEEKTQRFFRLFLTPHLGHCWDAPARTPDGYDWLTALENWVERGVPPDVVEASAAQPEGRVTTVRVRPFPLRPTVD